MLEMKISRLEESLANSRILDESMIDISRVQILNKVKIRNKANNTVMEYFIVSESEAMSRPERFRSILPLQRACLGKKVGDEVRYGAFGKN
jgi:transcription elongation factor GreA